MRKLSLSVFGVALALFATGCGDSPDSVIKDQISVMNEMCDVLETVKDKESAEKAKPKLEALGKKAKEIKARGEKLKMDSMSKEDKKKLEEKYKGDMEKVTTRLMGVMMKSMGNKEVQDALKDIDMGGMK